MEIAVVFLCILVAFLVWAVVHLSRRAQDSADSAYKMVLDLSERRFSASAGAALRDAHERTFQPAQPLHSDKAPPPMWSNEPVPPDEDAG